METIHADGSPLADYLEGEGSRDPTIDHDTHDDTAYDRIGSDDAPTRPSFAPTSSNLSIPKLRKGPPNPLHIGHRPKSSISRIHDACSTAVNSRLGRADNARFMEHFRYIIVASQLLNEYPDQGSFLPQAAATQGLDRSEEGGNRGRAPNVSTSVYGAAATATVAFTLVYLIHWARSSQKGAVSKTRVVGVVLLLAAAVLVGYAHVRRNWLKFLRRQAVDEVTALTANWQAFETSAGAALSLVQEVELVSRGYRISTPLPPASRIEDQGASRRCGRLRKTLHKVYAAQIPQTIDACNAIRPLICEDDLDKYFDVYDISPVDAREATGPDAPTALEDDPESLKSLRLLSYRVSILRRMTLCTLMAIEADGSKEDFARWRQAVHAMQALTHALKHTTTRLQDILTDLETPSTPTAPTKSPVLNPKYANRDKIRPQLRKLSHLSTGIRTLQAKMQILREETSRSLSPTSDTMSPHPPDPASDLGQSLLTQYDAIGTDLRDLMAAWETGRASLAADLNNREARRVSRASSAGLLSPNPSLGGLTAVEEEHFGSPADALEALNGGHTGVGADDGSSSAEGEGDEGAVFEGAVFEGVALPKVRERSRLTREERIVKMQEERERQAVVRGQRDARGGLLRELESVINLRPKGELGGGKGSARVTSI